VRSLLRGELYALDAQLKAALPLTVDEVTKRHYKDSIDQIATVLDPRAMRTRAPAGGAGAPGGRGGVK
jgi:hypothetical protein